MDCNKIKNTIPAYIIYLIYLNKLHNSNTFKYALQRQQKNGGWVKIRPLSNYKVSLRKENIVKFKYKSRI